jgi:hypothetical protein
MSSMSEIGRCKVTRGDPGELVVGGVSDGVDGDGVDGGGGSGGGGGGSDGA